MRKESLNFLKKLLTTPSPSGFERKGQKVWMDYVKSYSDSIETDTYGSAVATLNAGAKTSIVVAGHCDEIGLMVSSIEKDGFIYLQTIGGIDPAVVPGKRLNIHTRKGTVRGVTGATAIHLRDRDKGAEDPRKIHELFLDVGASSAEEVEKKGIRVGDAITFVDDFEMLDENLCIARALDNRIGTWIAAETLRLIKESKKKLNVTVHAASCVQEEIGLRGAQMTAMQLKPDMALVTDVGHATDSPAIDSRKHGKTKLGGGPLLSLGATMLTEMTDRIEDIAAKEKIPLQLVAEPGYSGTDADMFYRAGGGCATALVALPIRYMHTTVEMTDLRDLQRIPQLFAAFCLSLKKGETIKAKFD